MLHVKDRLIKGYFNSNQFRYKSHKQGLWWGFFLPTIDNISSSFY